MSDPDDESQSEESTRVETGGWRRPQADDTGDETDSHLNPDWRNVRTNRSTAARRSVSRSIVPSFPTSPQEIPSWLQSGGWRIVAGAAAVLVILLALLLLLRQPRSALQTSAEELPTTTAEEVSGVGADGTTLQQATVTVPPQPTQPPVGGAFVVGNTDGQGLFLRADHASASEALETLPDGTRVEQIGEDFSGPDRVWRHVRAPSGKEGWVAVEWLQPAQ